MKEKKQKKLAKKAFDELTNSGYVITRLKDLFMMQDYSDKDVITALKYAAKEVRKAHQEEFNFKFKNKKNKDNEYDDFGSQHERVRLDSNDKTKVVGKGRNSAILDNLDSLLG